MENAQRLDSSRRDVEPTTQRPTRGVPSDWFIDPADPQAADHADVTLDDQATAFLAAHEALESTDALAETGSTGADLATVTALHPGDAPAPQSAPDAGTWLGIPGFGHPEDEGELAWQADALCAQTDPEAFFPEKGGSTRDAKKVCSACTVRSECLEYALANDERFGIWGGLSERERRRLRKKSS
ncbi:WhiB family transcriptional regulator [Citricoccus muralis]|uniref:Transcriptional regulator WhiB n=1 Tax=Citricoccus muralis TaxID=169134 RepID=A0ABY8H8B0_9MICC|nr:WhiB family transcriptional regulator [Citricoccus muralis]WFP17389.1 WhiB family transcriptional regulator [Citricoccus muralis]